MKVELTSTALISDSRGRVLLIKRSKEPWKGLWGFPGGHVDSGETPEQTILREVKEETGLEVEVESLLEVFFYPVSDHYHLSHLFKCRVVGSLQLNPSEEWVHEGELKWRKPSQGKLNPVVEYVFQKHFC